MGRMPATGPIVSQASCLPPLPLSYEVNTRINGTPIRTPPRVTTNRPPKRDIPRAEHPCTPLSTNQPLVARPRTLPRTPKTPPHPIGRRKFINVVNE